MRLSRIKHDATFDLSDLGLHKFVCLGKSSNSMVHTAFLNKRVTSECSLSDRFKITGYCSYYFIKSNNSLVGVMFASFLSKTEVTSYRLRVVRNSYTDVDEPEEFVPDFKLEKSSLLLFSSNCGSVLAIPADLQDKSSIIQMS
jgi:hypothetical protein